MDVPVIAVGGGPCGGKSSFLRNAASYLASHGVLVIVVPETATKLINIGVAPWTVGLEEFQRRVLRASLARERRYLKIARRIAATGRRVVVLVDRGLLDCEAYVGEALFAQLLSERRVHRIDILYRYRMHVHLVTAANGAVEFYTLENNAARTETVEQAIALDERSLHAWRGHQHTAVIGNETDFKGKMLRAVQAMARVLHMPIPLENERRFLVLNFAMSFIPDNAAKIDIVQTYLTRPTQGERRVRSSTHDGHTMYTYTHKIPTGTHGSAHEDEPPPISKAEYEAYLREADPERKPVLKTRYKWPFKGHVLEVDVYQSEPWKSRGTIKLEVEVADLAEHIDFPEGWELLEVTDDPTYLNSNMAYAA